MKVFEVKNYRIKNKGCSGYVVQERMWFFFWFTIKGRMKNSLILYDDVFETVKEAREYITKSKEDKLKCIEANYEEYL